MDNKKETQFEVVKKAAYTVAIKGLSLKYSAEWKEKYFDKYSNMVLTLCKDHIEVYMDLVRLYTDFLTNKKTKTECTQNIRYYEKLYGL